MYPDLPPPIIGLGKSLRPQSFHARQNENFDRIEAHRPLEARCHQGTAAAGGSLTDIETTPAMTAKDAHATFVSAAKAAKSFRSAGRA
jgi:hypothetical protein